MEREDRFSTQNGTERDGTERNRTIQKKRNKNGMIQLKALVLEWNKTISKKSERAQPYSWLVVYSTYTQYNMLWKISHIIGVTRSQ